MKKFLFITVFALSVGGCSTSFMYNNLDWLVHWYIDDYVELTSEQKDAFDSHMRQWLAWHRSEELVVYQNHLLQLNTRIIGTPLTKQQWLSEFEKARTHWQRLLQELDDDLSELILKLRNDQITSIFDALEQRNQETEKRRQARDKNWRSDKLEDDVIRWIGPLSESQQQLIRDSTQKLESNFTAWMQYRRKWQSEAKKVALSREDTNKWRQAMSNILLNPDQFKDAEYQQKSNRNRQTYAALLADLHMSLTEKQKRHLQNEIQDLINAISDLMDDT